MLVNIFLWPCLYNIVYFIIVVGREEITPYLSNVAFAFLILQVLPLPIACALTARAFSKISWLTEGSQFETKPTIMKLNIFAQALASICALLMAATYLSENSKFTSTIYMLFAAVDLTV